MEEKKQENKNMTFDNAAKIIKDAIVRARYQAATIVNRELLGLYYAVGKYVSDNSRKGYWGQNAVKRISEDLQKELPGLRGFSEAAMRKMRLFYEEWQPIFTNRSLSMNDLDCAANPNFTKSQNGLVVAVSGTINGASLDLNLLVGHADKCVTGGFSADYFFKVGFTHHSEILAKEKSLEGRLFYIAKCAAEFCTVDTLKSYLRGDLYSKMGTIPSNFLHALPEPEQAWRAIRAFRDDYLLDFINIEEGIDPEDVDERLFERNIVANIKQFILAFGNKFCFIGNQYRIMVYEQEVFVDLLFFNRELRCLVAVELKRGEFKPSYLGQLNFQLSALDEFVRQADEGPSIGILLCKEANRNIVEFAVRDYTKPMGVATYRTKNEMPDEWQKALPDVEDMKNLLGGADDEQKGND